MGCNSIELDLRGVYKACVNRNIGTLAYVKSVGVRVRASNRQDLINIYDSILLDFLPRNKKLFLFREE